MSRHAYRESQGPQPTVIDLPCAPPVSVRSFLGWLVVLLLVSLFCKTFELECGGDGRCEVRTFSSFGLFAKETSFGAEYARLSVVEGDETEYLSVSYLGTNKSEKLEKGADSLGLGKRRAIVRAYDAYRAQHPNYTAFREAYTVGFPLVVVAGLWALFVLYRLNKKWTLTFLPVDREVVVEKNKHWFKKRSRVGFDEIKKLDVDYSFDSYNNRSQKLVIRLRLGEPIELCDAVSSPENGTGKEVGVLQQQEWLTQMTRALYAAGYEAESPFSITDGRHPANRK